MTAPKKRIIVDGIDLSNVVHFPRILAAVTGAMQPPRLVIALFIVVALVSVGKTWDAATIARIAPGGLLAPPVTPAEAERANGLLRRALVDYVHDDFRPNGWETRALDAREVDRLVRRGYRNRRDYALRGTGEADGQGIGFEAMRRNDEAFFATLANIEQVRPKGAFEASCLLIGDGTRRVVQGVFFLDAGSVVGGLTDITVRLPVRLWRVERAFTFAYGLFFLLVVSIGGGALARMSACEFAGREKLRVSDGIDFALRSWGRLVMAPLLPVILAGALAGILLVVGVLMNVPVLDVVAGLLYGVALVIGFLITFILVGTAAAFPLLIPAVACENCDPADALQRAYAYLLRRPLHLAGYFGVAIVGFAIGYFVVAALAVLMLNTTAGLFGTLTDSSAMSAAGGFSLFELAPRGASDFHVGVTRSVSAGLVSFWQTIVVELVIAWGLAYVFASSTRIYLLMRRAADGQDIAEIWRPGLVPGTLAEVPVGAPAAVPGGTSRRTRIVERGVRGVVRAAVLAYEKIRRRGAGPPDATDTEDLGPELLHADEIDESREVVGTRSDER
jgi:hypothetical protein